MSKGLHLQHSIALLLITQTKTHSLTNKHMRLWHEHQFYQGGEKDGMFVPWSVHRVRASPFKSAPPLRYAKAHA